MSADPNVFTRPGHTATVVGVGWGEPQTIYTRCTCGWVGINIEERYFTPGDTDFKHFAEPYRTIVRTYGPDSILADNTAYGTRTDATKQALAHIDYDPDTDRTQVLVALLDATRTLDDTATMPDSTLTHIQDAAAPLLPVLRELDAAAARQHAWEQGTLPTLPQRHPEAQRLLTAHRTPQNETD